jgi:GNAT superfamily N-acetyltransferase
MRRMTRAELDVVVGWAIDEGWNPGVTDADAFFAADPDGFFVGELHGELIASISVVRYADGRAFLGFYIVRPEHRGRGYGLALWDHARAQVDTSSTALEGVVAQIANYERSGFSLLHRTIRYATGAALGGASAGGAATSATPGLDVRRSTAADLEALVAYDAAVFGCERSALLLPWVLREDARTVVALRSGAIVGYGTIRPSSDGERIGPLFADDASIAGDLVDALIASAPAGTTVSLDVPDADPAAIELAVRRGMSPEFETARMVDGAPQPLAWPRIFGVTSLELG